MYKTILEWHYKVNTRCYFFCCINVFAMKNGELWLSVLHIFMIIIYCSHCRIKFLPSPIIQS